MELFEELRMILDFVCIDNQMCKNCKVMCDDVTGWKDT